MHSVTKRVLTPAQIQQLSYTALGVDARVTAIEEFTDGYFNAAFGLRLVDGRELVLKVAPDPGLKLLRYEVDLMHTEIEFYRRAGEVGLPVPALRYAHPDGEYLIVDRLRGESLNTAKESMSPEQLAEVRRELGQHCARLGAVTGPLFGYPRRDGRTRSGSWRESFLTIIDDILADAVDHDRELPMPAHQIAKLISRYGDLLDEVTTPVLVHYDIWDGNVFVRRDGEAYRVEGIIDGERAFYGDPIAELTSLAPLTDAATLPGLLDGFLGRDMSEAERTRLRLYAVYLDLILVTEGATRGYGEEGEPLRKYALGHLAAELALL